MKPAGHIALWLAAVIVTIAAALMPTGARAHGSHAHAPVAQPVADAPLELTGRSLAAVASEHVVPAQTAGLSRLACACPACAACGHAPSSCCATGLAPSPVPVLAPPMVQARATVGDGPRLSGILPEAQIEPPRPFA
ncbi:hypothetical protein MZTS_02620 [Methylorubrum zatmanii]|nr:hypothetical protein [Methylorubrum zatmanii]